MCDQMAATCHDGVPHVHAMAHDDAGGGGSGGLLALGLNASNGLKPFAFTVDTVRFALLRISHHPHSFSRSPAKLMGAFAPLRGAMESGVCP